MIAGKYWVTASAIILAIWAISFAAAAYMPASIPVHWNLAGEVDRYGSPWELALGVPLGASFVIFLMIVLPLVGPFEDNFKQFATTYGRIVVLIAGTMLAIQAAVLAKGLGINLPVQAIFLPMLGIMFAMLGNWMGKIRRNFWIGIRTPWTLANDTVWERTHRVGGRLFVIYGLLVALVGFFAPPIIAMGWLLGGLIVLVVWSLIYSQRLYRRLGHVDEI